MHIHSNRSTLGQSFISKQIYTQLDSKPLSEVHIVVNFHFSRCLVQQPSKPCSPFCLNLPHPSFAFFWVKKYVLMY